MVNNVMKRPAAELGSERARISAMHPESQLLNGRAGSPNDALPLPLRATAPFFDHSDTPY